MVEGDNSSLPEIEKAEQKGIGVAEDAESLKRALEAEKEKADKYLYNWQRAEADLLNFKKRSEQERLEQAGFVNATLMANLLPVLDDLERALVSIFPSQAEVTWVEGIKLIYRKLQAALQAQGLAEIEAEGKVFDPSLHEAVLYGEGEEGKVVEVLQKGYKFRERVLRPAMVKVGRGVS